MAEITDPVQARTAEPDASRRVRRTKAAATVSEAGKPKTMTRTKTKTALKAKPASPCKKVPASSAGRLKGSRGRLGEAFLAALQADFLEHGPQTIAALRDKAPATYVNTVAGLMPKDVKISDERDLSDDELLERIRQLDAVIAPLLRPQGAETPDGGS